MQTNDAETAEQITALESAVPALQGLEGLLAEENGGRRSALERAATDLANLGERIAGERDRKMTALKNFADDSPGLQQLKDVLADEKARPVEFNLFQELNLWWQEDVHSRVLTWLLGPNNSHGIGDYFLKHFLAQIDLPDCISAIKDWSKSVSQKEWHCVVDGNAGWLDILITNADVKFACAIENKIRSPEGGRQLTHYRTALKAEYPNFTRRYVFLSPKGMESQWADEQEYWKPMRYTTISQLVEQTLEDKRAEMSKDVRSFLRQYAATLRRNRIVPESTEIAKLARKIYLEHREAIELIYRHKPDYRDDMKQILKEAISTHTDWKLYRDDPSFVYFQPLGFTHYQGMQPGDSHARYSLVGCEFHCLQEGNAWFRVEIAPETESNKLVRDRIVDTINQHPEIFNSAGQAATGWMILHQGDYILDDGDLSNWDDHSVREKIEAWVNNFAENEFPAMNKVIVDCLREYEAETQGQ